FQAEDGIRDRNVTGVQTLLFRSPKAIPKVRNSHATVAQGRDQRAHAESSCPASSAESQTQRRQRTPHNPYTEGADEISDPHLAKAGSDPFLPWVPEQGARTGLTSTVQIARSPL